MENDYIRKLRESLTEEQMEELFGAKPDVVGSFPHFQLGDSRYYPEEDVNETLATSYVTSKVRNEIDELKKKVWELEAEKLTASEEINSYIDEITKLEADLKECRAKLSSRNEAKAVEATDSGFNLPDIEEYYPGEVLGTFIKAMSEFSRNNNPSTPTESSRAYIVAEAILKMFPIEKMATIHRNGQEFKESINRAVEKAYDGNTVDLAPLKAIGFEDISGERSKHWKVKYKNDEMTFSISRTPSARTSRENCKKSITSKLCII